MARPSFDPNHTALVIVDLQPDFMPGGALPTDGGDTIVKPVNDLLRARPFKHVVATQDWHPPQHVSFASNHAGHQAFDVIQLYGHEQTLWPDHCVQGTPGAALHPELASEPLDVIIRKGADPAVDSYSGFFNNWSPDGRRPPTGLRGYLQERNIDTLFVCGLARDVCVKWTAEDGAKTGFDVHLIWDLTRPVDAANDARVAADLEERGVTLVQAAELLATG